MTASELLLHTGYDRERRLQPAAHYRRQTSPAEQDLATVGMPGTACPAMPNVVEGKVVIIVDGLPKRL